MPVKTANQKKYILWMKKNSPKLYRAAIAKMSQSTLLGEEPPTPENWFSSLTNTIMDLAPKYLQLKQQKDVMKMQMKRAQQGLPPANVADYAPVVKADINLAPETRKEIIEAGQSSLNDMMKPLLIGGGLLALYFVMKKR